MELSAARVLRSRAISTIRTPATRVFCAVRQSRPKGTKLRHNSARAEALVLEQTVTYVLSRCWRAEITAEMWCRWDTSTPLARLMT